MPQGILSYKYEEEKKEANLTALAGLPLYLDLAVALGLPASISRHCAFRLSQGWTDSQIILSLVFLALAGGDCVDDLRMLQADEGLCRLLHKIDPPCPDRFRKPTSRTIPSSSSVFRYLSLFHASDQPVAGAAVIPSVANLDSLARVNQDLITSVQTRKPFSSATVDIDATLAQTQKKDALFCYQGYKAFQPLNVFWAEPQVVLHTEFRPGNVPANYDLLRVFKDSLSVLPDGVTEVRLRSDAAGYCHDLLAYCDRGENERFGRIEFAVSCPVTEAFKKEARLSEWKRLDDREWAEVGFVPNELAYSKKGQPYRYIAIREVLHQPVLPGIDLPFPTMTSNGIQYKVHALCSNMALEGEKLIAFAYERCGKSEEAHAILKDDLFGGRLPSGNFGENAAWWWITVLAFNLNAAMKRLALGEGWLTKRMKAIRFSLICLPGRIVDHARELVIRLVKGHPSLPLLREARQRIMRLAPS